MQNNMYKIREDKSIIKNLLSLSMRNKVYEIVYICFIIFKNKYAADSE